jgi:hypothetical protein
MCLRGRHRLGVLPGAAALVRCGRGCDRVFRRRNRLASAEMRLARHGASGAACRRSRPRTPYPDGWYRRSGRLAFGWVEQAAKADDGECSLDWATSGRWRESAPPAGAVAGCGRAVEHGAARTGPDRGAVRTWRAARARPRWRCPGRRECRGGGPAGCGSSGGPQHRRCAGTGSRR